MHMFKAQKIYQAEFSQVSHYHYNLKLQQMFHFKYVSRGPGQNFIRGPYDVIIFKQQD